MGSILNIGGNYFPFNVSKTETEADLLALTNDWESVGKDIMTAKSILDSE